MSARHMAFVLGSLVTLAGCTDAQIQKAAAEGQLFCAKASVDGPLVVALATAAGAPVIATGAAADVVKADCAIIGAIPVSPPANAAVVPVVAASVPVAAKQQ